MAIHTHKKAPVKIVLIEHSLPLTGRIKETQSQIGRGLTVGGYGSGGVGEYDQNVCTKILNNIYLKTKIKLNV